MTSPPTEAADRTKDGPQPSSRLSRSMKMWLFIAASIALIVVVCLIYGWFDRDPEEFPEGTIRLRLEMRDARYNPHLFRVVEPDGTLRYTYIITNEDGTRTELTPEEFSHRIFDEIHTAPWWAQVFNISSTLGLIWISVGLLGQVLFTGRMIVQWLVSERARRSVVPAAFWWMSLIGATMLLVYFLWRKDLVGVLGQGTGWLIYIRNLYLLYRWKKHSDVTQDADPEPALETRG